MKAKQVALFAPVDWYFKRQSHELLGGELRRILSVDDRCGDVRSERRKAQEARDVARGNMFLAGNSM